MARPTIITKLMVAFSKTPDVEKMVELRGQIDGMAALFRTKDGNAYEVTIVPAEYSKHPSIKAMTLKREGVDFVEALLEKLDNENA